MTAQVRYDDNGHGSCLVGPWHWIQEGDVGSRKDMLPSHLVSLALTRCRSDVTTGVELTNICTFQPLTDINWG